MSETDMDCGPSDTENPDTILDSPHLSQRQKEDALVAWLFAKVGKPPTPENVEGPMTDADRAVRGGA